MNGSSSSPSIYQNSRTLDIIVTPTNIINQIVDNDLKNVGRFWGDRVEEEEDVDNSKSGKEFQILISI